MNTKKMLHTRLLTIRSHYLSGQLPNGNSAVHASSTLIYIFLHPCPRPFRILACRHSLATDSHVLSNFSGGLAPSVLVIIKYSSLWSKRFATALLIFTSHTRKHRKHSHRTFIHIQRVLKWLCLIDKRTYFIY